jgi:WD40 repeat protein
LASGSKDGTVKLWNINTGDCVSTLTVDSAVWSVAFCPDGSKIAAAYSNKIQIFDAQTQAKIVSPLTGHNDPVLSVCFSPCGTKIVSGGGLETMDGGNGDFSIRIWDSETGTQIGSPLTGHSDR